MYIGGKVEKGTVHFLLSMDTTSLQEMTITAIALQDMIAFEEKIK